MLFISVLIISIFLGIVLYLYYPLFSSLTVKSDKDFILSLPIVPTCIEVVREFGPIKVGEKDFSLCIDTNRVSAIIKDNLVYLYSTSITNEGEIEVIITSRGKKITNFLRVMIPLEDRDKDGYPDVLELRNDKSFIDWFCAIVESQFYHSSDIWYDVRKDCAGLVEFAFREALKKHDEEWAKKYKFLSDFSMPDERPYYYPDVPVLGKKIFRVRDGEFNIETVDEDFSTTASSFALRNYSMDFISRDIREIKKGDVLFFFKEDNLKMPSHSMIYIGPELPNKEDGFLVYHTGPSEHSKGFVKKVKLKELLRHPDPSWRPIPENREFIGIYRWKILR